MARALSLAEIFQLGYYWETKILLTAVKLDLFSMLSGKPRTAAETARRLRADERVLTLLMNALVPIGLLTKDGERFANAPVADTYLVRSASAYVGHLLMLQDAEWGHWGQLEDTVKTGRSPVRGHLFTSNPVLGASVLSVLDRIGQQSGSGLAARAQLDQATTMLDLGGGMGTNAIAFCRTYSSLRATVFDLPQTVKLTERTVKEAGLEDRITLLPGDFNVDPLGGPYDAVLMSDVLHYQGPEANAALVRKCFAHLNPKGRLIIKDRFLEESGTGPAWVTAFAVHILLNTEHGRCYAVSDVTSWMQEAGFQDVTEVERTAVVQGRKKV